VQDIKRTVLNLALFVSTIASWKGIWDFQDTSDMPWWQSVGIGIVVYILRFKVDDLLDTHEVNQTRNPKPQTRNPETTNAKCETPSPKPTNPRPEVSCGYTRAPEMLAVPVLGVRDSTMCTIHRRQVRKVDHYTLHPTPYTPHPTPHTIHPSQVHNEDWFEIFSEMPALSLETANQYGKIYLTSGSPRPPLLFPSTSSPLTDLLSSYVAQVPLDLLSSYRLS
jgi:hypothetical protein